MNRIASAIVALAFVLSAGVAFAGRVPDPGIAHDRVQANGTVTYHDTFRGGEVAVITVEGDGDTDLDLLVYDGNGNLIASDLRVSGHCRVSFRPRWTGTFRIVVINRGGVYNDYTISTN